MIRELRIYWRLRPYLAQLKELGRMKLSVNVIIQVLALVAQAANAVLDLMPTPRSKAIAAGVIAIAQGVAAGLAHFSNPDGTPAAAPYIRGPK